MYAVIETGGKQYRVAKDDVIEVEKLPGEKGGQIAFDQVLMTGAGDAVIVGRPHVPGAKVTAEIVDQTKAPKIIVFKKLRRKNHRRKKGHRQNLTVLKIVDIQGAA
ncbi:MAG: 50S ribosomal protein L21 [Alphaproteobacteria bacterium]|nr:50S ribosomal protein L21 [Alphaproteobacteria bacterium]